MSNDIDTKPIVIGETISYIDRCKIITNCPDGKSFTKHLEELMYKLKSLASGQ